MELLGVEEEEIIKISAKTGENVTGCSTRSWTASPRRTPNTTRRGPSSSTP